MGSGNSKPEDEFASAKSLFKGQKQGVNFVAKVINNTDFGLQFQGSWLKRGLNVYVSSTEPAFGKHPKTTEDLVLAAKNEKGFFRQFFGTSGVSLWSIEDTNYCLVLAWDIPHYRKLFKRANTIAVSSTVRKIEKFTATQILREIIFGDFKSIKTAILAISNAPNFYF